MTQTSLSSPVTILKVDKKWLVSNTTVMREELKNYKNVENLSTSKQIKDEIVFTNSPEPSALHIQNVRSLANINLVNELH